MMKPNSLRARVPAMIAAGVILLAGGAAIASNMGFKMNKALYPRGGAGISGNVGKNYTSLPYNNPYGTAQGLCAQTGVDMHLPIGNTTITRLNDTAAGAGFTTVTCSTAATAPNFSLVSGKMLEIKMPTSWPSGQGVIIVGSHNPAFPITTWKAQNACANSLGNPTFTTCTSNANCPGSTCIAVGKYWLSVPYHTTAVTANDLCLQAGFKTTFPGTTITRLNGQTGQFTTVACNNSAQAAGLNLVLGEGLEIADTNGAAGNPTATTFTPAHF